MTTSLAFAGCADASAGTRARTGRHSDSDSKHSSFTDLELLRVDLRVDPEPIEGGFFGGVRTRRSPQPERPLQPVHVAVVAVVDPEFDRWTCRTAPPRSSLPAPGPPAPGPAAGPGRAGPGADGGTAGGGAAGAGAAGAWRGRVPGSRAVPKPALSRAARPAPPRAAPRVLDRLRAAHPARRPEAAAACPAVPERPRRPRHGPAPASSP